MTQKNKITQTQNGLDRPTFSCALEKMNKGEKVSRKKWNAEYCIYIQCSYNLNGTLNEDMLELHSDGSINKWYPEQEDILASDWYEVTII